MNNASISGLEGKNKMRKNDIIRSMYINENLTVSQIADQTGYTAAMIRHILENEMIYKHDNIEKPVKPKTDDTKKKEEKCPINLNHTYTRIDYNLWVRDDGVLLERVRPKKRIKREDF